MSIIPKTTSPLTKFIRTGEGILVFACNLALLIVPLATSALSANQALKYAVILNGATVVARSILKALSALKIPGADPNIAGGANLNPGAEMSGDVPAILPNDEDQSDNVPLDSHAKPDAPSESTGA